MQLILSRIQKSEGGNAAERGVWRAKPMRSAQPERLRGVTDWLRGSFKTMMHCGNGCVDESPLVPGLCCVIMIMGLTQWRAELLLTYTTSGSSLGWMEALLLTHLISTEIFLTKCLHLRGLKRVDFPQSCQLHAITLFTLPCLLVLACLPY